MARKVFDELFLPNRPIGFPAYYIQVSICIAYYMYFWATYNHFTKYVPITWTIAYNFSYVVKYAIYFYLCYRLIMLGMRRLRLAHAKLLFLLPIFIPFIWIPDNPFGWEVRLWALYILFVGTLE